MKVMEWLLQGNSTITHLVKTQLLHKKDRQLNDGYICEYLNRYDENTMMWGNGLYGPKWISTTYTLLDLIHLQATPTKHMINGYNKLRREIVQQYTLNHSDKRTLDLCIVGMLIHIGAYLDSNEASLQELIDFVLYTIHTDGAWNCYYNHRSFETSSLHTTINILEGLLEYCIHGYTYRLQEVQASMKTAEEFILKKHLFRSRRTNHIIDPRFLKVHFPTRWYYDMYRALDYFVEVNQPYDERLQEGLTIISNALTKGPLPKGPSYAGKLHFKYDLADYRRINTLRALKIMKHYDNELYKNILVNPSFVKM